MGLRRWRCFGLDRSARRLRVGEPTVRSERSAWILRSRTLRHLSVRRRESARASAAATRKRHSAAARWTPRALSDQTKPGNAPPAVAQRPQCRLARKGAHRRRACCFSDEARAHALDVCSWWRPRWLRRVPLADHGRARAPDAADHRSGGELVGDALDEPEVVEVSLGMRGHRSAGEDPVGAAVDLELPPHLWRRCQARH
jgi:hypothetical protein